MIARGGAVALLVLFGLSQGAGAESLSFDAAAHGKPAHYTAKVDGTRLVVIDDATSRELASAPAASTRRLVVRGADGAHDDTLTVDVTGLALPDGIDYDGGAGGFDTLVIHGGATQARQTATQLSKTDGILDLGGLQLRYTNLEPITDTTSAVALTIVGTGGGEEIRILDGPVVGTTQTTRAESTAFETIDFASKANVTVNGGGGADNFIVNNPTPAAGLASVTLTGGALIDRFVLQNHGTIPYTVTGGLPNPPGGGDSLIVSLAGVTTPVLSIASDANGLQGTWTFGNRGTVRSRRSRRSIRPTFSSRRPGRRLRRPAKL